MTFRFLGYPRPLVHLLAWRPGQAERSLHHLGRSHGDCFGLLREQTLQDTEYRPFGHRGHPVHAGVLPNHYLRALAGVPHVRVLPLCKQGNGVHQRTQEVGADKDSWAQYFRKNGYHSARISKVFHMGVPPDISKGSDGADDPQSWDEAYNSKGPETKVPGRAEQLSNNPGGLKKGTGSSQSFNAVEAEGDDLVHSDGKTAQKAVELLHKYKDMEKPFFLAGFVRPHVPLVARKIFRTLPTRQNIAAAQNSWGSGRYPAEFR